MGAWPGGKLLPRVSCLNDSRETLGTRLGRAADLDAVPKSVILALVAKEQMLNLQPGQ